MGRIELPNTQPTEKRHLLPTGDLDVFKVWDTIQGEGPMAGVPSVFVRLAGCNLQCPGCDTDYTSQRKWYNPVQLVDAVELCASNRHQGKCASIILTGGEPFRQNFIPFAMLAVKRGHMVHIESNGTLSNSDLFHKEVLQAFDTGGISIVCSPKAEKIHKDLSVRFIKAFKYVLNYDSIDPTDGLPRTVLENGTLPVAKPFNVLPENVYLQPAETNDPERNKKNLDACVRSCMKFGYTLSLQIHKIVGLE